MSSILAVRSHLSRWIGSLAVATLALASAGAQADNLSVTNASSMSAIGNLNFTGGTAGPKSTGNIYIGSYQLSNGDWVYCLSPYTHTSGTTSFDKVSLNQFLNGGGYAAQFALNNPNYVGLAPGYAAQPTNTVLSKIVNLYNWAYADTLTGTAAQKAEKSAAFAFALWEIEGETSANWGTNVGNLQVTGFGASVVSYANTLLNALKVGTAAAWNSAGFSTFKPYQFDVWQANPIASSQSFLVVRDAPENRTGVPEPSTALLLAASALAFIGARRRRQKQA
jgi:PEP-CTERM motif